MRIHQVEAPTGFAIREGGWALASDDVLPAGETGPGWAAVRRADGLSTALVGVLGWDENGRLPFGEVAHAQGRNAVGQFSAAPSLTLTHHHGGTRLLVTLVVLTADPKLRDDLADLCALAQASAAPDGTTEVRFPDGTITHVRRSTAATEAACTRQ